ncbi:MAG TPA: polysaccharide deacetylase family protein [Candidatus Omnitrophota bacterium]|nr:polysaccharide deacetylase family protein [Candidatus Omnitrophota bacterium]HPS36777.1 polysaccharide deacetylase family protein [Candidatus Omnitrophota bacterium]
MSRAMGLWLVLWISLAAFFPSLSFASPSRQQEESEDYKLLREIIVTEFASETPHEWGKVVSGVKTRLKTDAKVITLGFDICAPAMKASELELIRFLQTENIPATFFVSGDWIDANREFLKKLAANPLFEIANHGLDQKPCSINGKSAGGRAGTGSVEEVFSEIEKNARKIESVTGVLPQYYRAGAEYYDEVAVRIIRALGYEAVGTGLRLPEGTDVTKRQVLEAFANPAAGAIAVLQPATLNKTVSEGVIEAVRKLKTKGYQFVKLSEYNLE